MGLAFPQPSIALDPLIAEAKRRARRRRAQLMASVAVFLAGGTTLVLASGLLNTTPSHVGPYVPGGMFTGTGGGVVSTGPPSWGGLTAVSAASGSDAWAIGPVAWHWDGQAWRRVALPRGGESTLWAAADAGPGDAWAVGARGNGNLLGSHALIEHWNGARWSVVRLLRLPASFLFGVSTAGPRNAWAVGGTFAPNRAHPNRAGKSRPLLLHWDGRTWSRQSLPWAHRGVVLDRVMATGPSGVWAVSDGLQDGGRPVALRHWNGSRWQTAPPPFGASDPFGGFSATAWNDAWAVGSYGYGGNRVTTFSHPLAAHWNGRSWQMSSVPKPAGSDNSFALVSVDAVRPDQVFVLGESQHLELQGTTAFRLQGRSDTSCGGTAIVGRRSPARRP